MQPPQNGYIASIQIRRDLAISIRQFWSVVIFRILLFWCFMSVNEFRHSPDVDGRCTINSGSISVISDTNLLYKSSSLFYFNNLSCCFNKASNCAFDILPNWSFLIICFLDNTCVSRSALYPFHLILRANYRRIVIALQRTESRTDAVRSVIAAGFTTSRAVLVYLLESEL